VGSGAMVIALAQALALVQLNGDIFLFYNKSLGDLNLIDSP